MTSDVDVLLFLSHWCCVGKGGKEGGGHLGSMISALFARRRLGALRAAPDRAGSNSPSLDIRGKTKKGQVDWIPVGSCRKRKLIRFHSPFWWFSLRLQYTKGVGPFDVDYELRHVLSGLVTIIAIYYALRRFVFATSFSISLSPFVWLLARICRGLVTFSAILSPSF